VRVIGTFPEDTHPPITYPVALVASSSNEAAVDFLSFLRSPQAQTAFEKWGFTMLNE
jgi:molybdate transport system substrate-binding protein